LVVADTFSGDLIAELLPEVVNNCGGSFLTLFRRFDDATVDVVLSINK
jgi:hypothetical protein